MVRFFINFKLTYLSQFKLTTMTKSQKTGSIILAGLAAYGMYKFSKLTAEDKNKLAENLKEQGKKMIDKITPHLKETFARAGSAKTFQESNS